MAKDYTQVNFRIPTALKEMVEQSAAENDRSITAEIVYRLENSFKNNENTEVTKRLLEDAILQTLRAVKEDPNLINNPRVTVIAQKDADSNEESRVTLVNSNKNEDKNTPETPPPSGQDWR